MVAPLSIPYPTKEPGQRSLDIGDIYLLRNSPTWMRPNQFTAKAWRGLVLSQPIAMICKEFLIANLLALDWKISAVDSEQNDELKGVIKHYTNLLMRGDFDLSQIVEMVGSDLLDIPFGGAAEIGRKGDTPEGRVQWIRHIDGGTLYPTLNADYPVIQYYATMNPIAFPKHAIARTYMSPRTEIERAGWGMAPPEKIYFALTMIGQGDSYYANLLLDIPPVGILDLMDMAKDSAIEWVNSYRDFLASGGQKSFKIPVLYEHTQDVKFIQFGKAPNDIMYDRITLKYAAIVCAGYGLGLSDIGINTTSSSGETLAGTIRQQRSTRKNGFAVAKKKLATFINSFLPPTLQFSWIDYDDELNVALGRARLANSTAAGQWIKDGVFGPDEMRRQAIADGLVSISLPETLSDSERKKILEMTQSKKAPERPGAIGTKEPASMGGTGEVVKSIVADRGGQFKANIKRSVKGVFDATFPIFSQTNEQEHLIYDVQEAIKKVPTKWLKLEITPETRSAFIDWLRQYSIQRAADVYQQDFLDELIDSPDIPLDVIDELSEQLSGIDVDTVYSQFENNLESYVRSFVLNSIVSTLKSSIFSVDGVDFDRSGDYTSIVGSIQNSIVSNIDIVLAQAIDACLKETFNSLRLEI